MITDILKLLALFTSVRIYNLIVLVLALYLTAFFIFSDVTSISAFLYESSIHYMVLANTLTVAGGYIINNFYDSKKDMVGRPLTTYIGQWLSQSFKLKAYVVLNVISLIFANLISWRVGLFIFCYQFLVWFYSHKLNKILFLNNITSVILALFPFLALMLFYNSYSFLILKLAVLTGLLLLLTDLCKDLSTHTADLVYSYKTLPVVLGVQKTKTIISIAVLITVGLSVSLLDNNVYSMEFYFFGLIPAILLFCYLLWVFNTSRKYTYLVVYLRVLTGLGVLSIIGVQYSFKDVIPFF